MPKLGSIIPVLGLLAFTNPNGVTIHVDRESIVAVTPGAGYCYGELTRINIGSGEGYCVRESVEEVVDRIKADADE